MQILAPNDPIFHYPNEITQHDFDGWVQERGLYFMDKWDEHFTALLACHDPGKGDQEGGLLEAHYRQRNVYLRRLRILPPVARGSAGSGAAVCEFVERGA